MTIHATHGQATNGQATNGQLAAPSSAIATRVAGSMQVSARMSTLGFGAAVLGNLYAEVSDAAAEATVHEALQSGIRYFDTAPHYGYGLSESRLGRALAGVAADETIVSTKVGRLIVPAVGAPSADGFAVSGWRSEFDYSREGILRSFESSLQRLRREHVDILLLHDVGRLTHGDQHERVFAQALHEALPAMQRLKESGACRAIGIGVNEGAVCKEVMSRFALDYILLAGRYTLLEQAGVLDVMAEAQRRNVGMLIGGVFNSGLLASAASPGATYDYHPVDDHTRVRAEKIYEICATHHADVGAAALQFPLAHPAVVSVVAGMRSVGEVRTAAERMRASLPAALWRDLRSAGVIRADAPTP